MNITKASESLDQTKLSRTRIKEKALTKLKVKIPKEIREATEAGYGKVTLELDLCLDYVDLEEIKKELEDLGYFVKISEFPCDLTIKWEY